MMSEAKKQLKILFIPKITGEEENVATSGLARKMIEKGHRVKFIVSDLSNKVYANLGFDFDVLERETITKAESKPENKPEAKPETKPEAKPEATKPDPSSDPNAQTVAQNLLNSLKPSRLSTWINMTKSFCNYLTTQLSVLEATNGQLEKVIARYNPDVFVTDDNFEYFSISRTDKPWVWLFNGNPLSILRDNTLPPPFSGMAADKPGVMWTLNRVFYNIFYKVLGVVFNYAMTLYGKPFRLIEDGSPYLNLFSYPKELDYANRKIFKQNYFRVDSFLLKDTKFKSNVKIPKEKLIGNGKDNVRRVVFVSMGRTHAANTFFMKKLLTILSKSPHLYIISIPESAQEYPLSENMWSDRTYTTMQLLERSELVITDGSNDMVTDAFTLAKPMLVIPMWLAQLDNAQRLHETGYGLRLSAWSFTEEQLLTGIQKMLDDAELKTKLTKASNRIWEENRLDKAAELIENLQRDRWLFM